MKLVHVGAIATGLVIVLGIAMVIPAFTQMKHDIPKQTVMLSFSIIDDSNTPSWCTDLSSVLKKHNVKATIFVTGKVAERYTECVSVFANNVKLDVGSQTYSYVKLPSIPDYSLQLEEVRNGKQAIDEAGKIYSRLFKAPYGSTDDNIYSLLSKSDIVADFSYNKQYNKYYNDQFIRFSIAAYDGSEYSSDFFYTLPIKEVPILINFENNDSIGQIDSFISQLKSSNINFVNASELTGMELTIREGE